MSRAWARLSFFLLSLYLSLFVLSSLYPSLSFSLTRWLLEGRLLMTLDAWGWTAQPHTICLSIIYIYMYTCIYLFV